MAVNGIAVASIASGSVLVWSGVKGWSVLATAVDIMTGKKPSGTNTARLVSDQTSVSGQSGIAFASNAISDDGLKYQGHAYSFGGAPGKNGQNPWDCSSFVNWVIGHDLKGNIPGYGPGVYDGSVHGPPTMSWGVWPGLQHISKSEVQAGDLIVWTGHMGIAISNDHMVSALNSKLGTLVTPIAGNGNGPIMCYGRLQ